MYRTIKSATSLKNLQDPVHLSIKVSLPKIRQTAVMDNNHHHYHSSCQIAETFFVELGYQATSYQG